MSMKTKSHDRGKKKGKAKSAPKKPFGSHTDYANYSSLKINPGGGKK